MTVFQGLRVLDVASFIAAPAAATILSDFGADVIKVEPPSGDNYREIYRQPNLPVCEHNYCWYLASRNKRSLVLDLKQPGGAAVLHRLVAAADVFVTNYPPAVRERLGLAWEQLCSINPRLIYASLTGYGEQGPEVNKPGYDATTYWARTGLADIVRSDPEGPPASAAPGMGDHPTGVALYAAIVTALYQRERTGCGAMVGTSLVAAGAWANGVSIQATLCGGQVVYREPRARPRNALANFYQCADGRWFVLSLMAEERLWPGFVQMIGREDLLADPRFASSRSRREHAPGLAVELAAAFAREGSAHWQALFEQAGHTVGVVARTADVAEDEQLRLAGAIVPAEGIPGGRTVSSPFQIMGVEKTAPRPAPALGEHSEEVLAQYGFDDARIAALRAARVLG